MCTKKTKIDHVDIGKRRDEIYIVDSVSKKKNIDRN
jgi:hypothetical protein